MARASTPTLLPLDTFARIIGMHPAHFNGVEVNDIALCGQPILQQNWQYVDRVSREEIAMAIADAEQTISQWAGFDLLPTWQVDERQHQRTGYRDARGAIQALRVDKGYVISGGIEAKVKIGTPAVVYSDVDGDAYFETATITQVLPSYVTNVDEVALYYPNQNGEDAWEIRPINVTIASGTATITCRREQLVVPTSFEAMGDVRAVNSADNGSFLTSVDVYRHYNDPQRQVQFMWEPDGSCNCGTCGSCSYTTQFGCLTVRNYRLGLVAANPSDWDAANNSFAAADFAVCGVQPTRTRLWYYAGWRDKSKRKPNVEMDDRWARAVSYLALGRLTRPLCGCNAIAEVSRYWGHDMAESHNTAAEAVSRRISTRLLNCPFGTTRGALYAWQQIQQAKIDQ